MDIKTEIVTLAVRVLKDKTNIIDTPDSFSELVTVITTGKSHDQRVAESVIVLAESVAKLARNTNTIRKFKKSIPDHV